MVRPMMFRSILMPAVAALTMAVAVPADAARVHTGGASGAYHSAFCPLLTKRLSALDATYTCATSLGSSENMRAVAANPNDFGYAQLDIFALEAPRMGGSRTFTTVRTDDARECVFAVTRNKNLTNYGEIAVNADTTSFILPPRSSGSSGTFEYLKSIDPEGLGRAQRIQHAADTDEAIRQALQDEKAVTFFVQFPDPDNERFRLIRSLGGHLVPVIDGLILSQKVKGDRIYFAQETEIEQPRWLRAGRTLITACTPMVLFTGATSRITTAEQRVTHRQLIENIRTLPTGDLLPQGSIFRRLVKQTREASTRARNHFLRLSHDARERARPYLTQLYRMTRDGIHTMIQKAQPQRY